MVILSEQSKYYSIGKVSTLCNVPVKTLRYYDQIGLLVPQYCKETSHYRYYELHNYSLCTSFVNCVFLVSLSKISNKSSEIVTMPLWNDVLFLEWMKYLKISKNCKNNLSLVKTYCNDRSRKCIFTDKRKTKSRYACDTNRTNSNL